jgi:hypothetical protein
VGFAQPSSGTPPQKICISGMRTVPTGSMWTSGLRLTRPWRAAVSSPICSAIQPWADSWTLREKSRTT